MKWAVGVDQRAKIPLILGALLLLLLANSYWEHINVQSLERSFSSMHDDRLISLLLIVCLLLFGLVSASRSLEAPKPRPRLDPRLH